MGPRSWYLEIKAHCENFMVYFTVQYGHMQYALMLSHASSRNIFSFSLSLSWQGIFDEKLCRLYFTAKEENSLQNGANGDDSQRNWNWPSGTEMRDMINCSYSQHYNNSNSSTFSKSRLLQQICCKSPFFSGGSWLSCAEEFDRGTLLKNVTSLPLLTRKRQKYKNQNMNIANENNTMWIRGS